MPKRISRSTFIKAALACAGLASGLPFVIRGLKGNGRTVPCRMLGPSLTIGHALRDGKLHAAALEAPCQTTTVTIVGGGIAGLSAAWWLEKAGVRDFIVLELEKEAGGNSRSGKNEISEYPWGAHYVPLANEESHYVRTMFEEFGIITGVSPAGEPLYNELYLCHEPQERLLKDGVFQDGMVPHRGLQPKEQAEMARFFSCVKELRQSKGQDGRPAFAIPLDLSSRDERYLALDRLSFRDWLGQNGFACKPLLWYLNYCCRDDYGATIENVSAWAGLHYFAGRRGTAANAEMNSVVTWPEGNGFLVKRFEEKLGPHLKPGTVVARVAEQEDRIVTSYLERESGRWHRLSSRYVVFAAPRFLAPHIIEGYAHSSVQAGKGPGYAPWLVANISLNNIPVSRGAALSWDNVSYNSDSLGYVLATHQAITTRENKTVITYYYPLSYTDKAAARRNLLSRSAQDWSTQIVADLTKMHPGIEEEILSIDLWPWGHGMVSPAPGFIWGEEREKMKQRRGRVFFAHSDMSGMSNFEEAQYHGVTAAAAIALELKTA